MDLKFYFHAPQVLFGWTSKFYLDGPQFYLDGPQFYLHGPQILFGWTSSFIFHNHFK